MKIACVMATRGNPRRAAAVIECANALSSGKHEIEWIICCDKDDAETINWHGLVCSGFRISLGAAPIGVGSVWNRGAALTDADIIAPFPDDSFPGLPDWDATICEHLPFKKQIGVIAWNDTANPNQCTLPVITRTWYEMCGLYDDRFPFWFYDTCVAELWSFVHGRPVTIPKNLLLAAKKGKTKSMRELAFWWGFYVYTRKERLAKAEQVRKQLGIEMAQDLLRHILENWEFRDAQAAKHFEAMERDMSAAEGEPPERYLKAKAAAQEIMSAKEEFWVEYPSGTKVLNVVRA